MLCCEACSENPANVKITDQQFWFSINSPYPRYIITTGFYIIYSSHAAKLLLDIIMKPASEVKKKNKKVEKKFLIPDKWP